jgi:hypothetical protein
MPSASQGAELQTNGSGNNALFIVRSSMSHNERQNRVLIIGGTMWLLSFVVAGVAYFAISGITHLTLKGLLDLVQALLQTIGAMVVAATDADLDMFAKKHPRSAFAFALAWIVLYTGLRALGSWVPGGTKLVRALGSPQSRIDWRRVSASRCAFFSACTACFSNRSCSFFSLSLSFSGGTFQTLGIAVDSAIMTDMRPKAMIDTTKSVRVFETR